MAKLIVFRAAFRLAGDEAAGKLPDPLSVASGTEKGRPVAAFFEMIEMSWR